MAPTIGLSAMLMFTLEPLVGRLMLPVFGGAPSVWATVLAFFQAILLLGYLYGHLSVTRLGIRRGALLHVAVSGVALAGLLLSASSHVREPIQALPPVVDLLLVLTVTVGPAAFVLSATTPLLSAWYVSIGVDGTGVTEGDRPADPYWLFAVSNGGSFAVLLAYPLLIEPWLGLTMQRATWTLGFTLLCLLLMGSAAIALARGPTTTRSPSTDASATDAAERPGTRRRLTWVLLAAVPAGLLAAVTNVVASDLVSAPLLWVIPLAIYLLTFVVAFSSLGRHAIGWAVVLAPAAVTLLWVPLGSIGAWPILAVLLLEYGCFAVVAAALHGRLALDRPDPVWLTEFYLLVAVGGALGGSFVAIVAPLLFEGIWEFPILLVGGLAALAITAPGAPEDAHDSDAGDRRFRVPGAIDRFRPFMKNLPHRLVPYVIVSLPLAIFLSGSSSMAAEAGARWLLVGGLLLLVGGRPAFLAVATGLVLALTVFVIPRDVILRDRSFFGVTEVIRPVGGAATYLMNGTTLHGVQSTDSGLRRTPVSYYTTAGPTGDVFAIAKPSSPGEGRSIGVIGLGAGSLATYAQPADQMTFYEIDPVVISVAGDPRYFTYLSDAPSRPAIVEGDARLSLGRTPSSSQDLLVLDAFSGDSVPAHLLTVEAFREYTRVLRLHGLLVAHVSNRYFDLAPAVGAAAERVGMTALVRSYAPSEAERESLASPSIWVVAAADLSDLEPFAARSWTPIRPAADPVTDDHPDLLRFLSTGLP